jgi:hypothetical protein
VLWLRVVTAYELAAELELWFVTVTCPESKHMHATAAAVSQVERSSDDTVKLKILQTALTLLQNPTSADDQVGLSLQCSANVVNQP